MLSANEAGNYRMADYFQWIFFNTNTQKYDTLHSRLSLQATGEKVAASGADTEGFGGFYSLISESNNELQDLQENWWIKVATNMLILSVLTVLLYQIIRYRPVSTLKIDRNFLNFRKTNKKQIDNTK